MGVLGAFQQDAFQNDAFQVNDYFGFEQNDAVIARATKQPQPQGDVGDPLSPLSGIWGFENTYPSPTKTPTTPPALDRPLPGLVGLWGWENAYPAPAKFQSTPPALDLPLPSLVGLWGWENAYPTPAKFQSTPPALDLTLPSLVGLWGWENTYPAPAKFQPTPPSLDLPLPSFLGLWGWENEYPAPTKPAQQQPFLDLSSAALSNLVGLWGFENTYPAPAKPSPQLIFEDLPLPAFLLGPGGWETQDLHPLPRKLAAPFPGSYEPLPALLGSWGWDNEHGQPAARRTSTVFVNDVIPYPALIPPFTIHLLVGGGGFKEYEIIDDYSERAIDDYIRLLYEDDYEDGYLSHENEENRGPVDPDAILGQAELEDERRSRREEKTAVKPPKTIYSFESVLDPISCHRVVMFANDARNCGVPIATTDAFRLKYKLGIFEEAYEKKMLDGAMVKVVPKKGADLSGLAKLATKHKYKLVAWTDEGLFLFDETTLRPKASGLLWMALGAGWGLILGHAIWSKPDKKK